MATPTPARRPRHTRRRGRVLAAYGLLLGLVGGLVARPVIACPTSVGYGATFGGLAALLAMLSSCTPGVACVNIDDGVGAGYVAALIARRAGTL